MLQNHDTILVNVTGTEGASKATKHVAQRFNHAGVAVDVQGNPQYGVRGLDVGNLQEGAAAAQGARIPEFPIDEFQRLQRAGDVAGVTALQMDYQRRLGAAQAQGVGVGPAGLYSALAKAALSWLKSEHGFSDNENDQNSFVLKAENIEITPIKVNGATIYQLSGTAVFGS